MYRTLGMRVVLQQHCSTHVSKGAKRVMGAAHSTEGTKKGEKAKTRKEKS